MEERMVDIWERALGFMDAQVLLAAEALGIFDRLDRGAATAAEVAAAAGLPPDSATRLLTALCALELVRREGDDRYVNGPEAAAQLVRDKPGYIGGLFRHLREELYPLWHHFTDALREGRAQWGRPLPAAPAPGEMYADPARLRGFLDGMHRVTYPAAEAFAASAAEMHDVGTIADLGGASGAFLIALARRLPGLRGTILDLPAVGPIAEEYIRESGLGDRLRFQACDLFSDPLPAGADAYAMGFILHDWDTEGGTFLLRKIAAASRPGALLILGEYLLDDDRTGPLHVARMDLNMLASARGRERTGAEYRAWVRECGFALERLYPVAHRV
jgi:hypothetical protein